MAWKNGNVKGVSDQVNDLKQKIQQIQNSSGGSGSTVSSSKVNGNVIVNGVETKVYDDTGIQTNMSNKADKGHTHVLSNITDVDMSNKINGNVLSYDSNSSKLVLKPVPSTSSNISSSGTNGNINVNGTDIKVYDDTNLKNSKADKTHTHVVGDVTGLQTILDGKAMNSHTHVINDIANLQTTLDGKASNAHTHSIANITNLQNSLDGKSNISHTHIISDITNLQSSLDSKASISHTHTISNISDVDVSNKLNGNVLTYDATSQKLILKTPPSSGGGSSVTNSLTNGNIIINGAETKVYDDTSLKNSKANVTHTHIISDISNLQSSLDAKANSTHTHTIADITNLQTTLDNKANIAHSHTIGNISDIDTTNKTDGNVLTYDATSQKVVLKAPTSGGSTVKSSLTNGNIVLNGVETRVYDDSILRTSKANTNHTHAITDVTNLQTTLAGKAPVNHQHVVGDVTGLQGLLDGKSDSSHTHTISGVTGLQTILDSKSNTDHTHTLSSLSDVATKNPTEGQMLQFKSGKWTPVAAPAGGSGDSYPKLVGRYVHSGNKVIQPTSLNLATGIFTTGVDIGLAAGTKKSVMTVVHNSKNGVLPREYSGTETHSIEVIDNRNFYLLGGTGTRLTFPNAANTNVDPTAFHFEYDTKNIDINIESLRLKRIRLIGYGTKTRPGYSYFYVKYKYAGGSDATYCTGFGPDTADAQKVYWEQEWKILPECNSIVAEGTRSVKLSWSNSSGGWNPTQSSNNLGGGIFCEEGLEYFMAIQAGHEINNGYVIEIYDLGGV